MTIGDTGQLTTEEVSAPAALDSLFELFGDEQTLLVELDADGRIVRCNPGYASFCNEAAEELAGSFPTDLLSVRVPAGSGNPGGGAPAPRDYPLLDCEQWLTAGGACHRVSWLKLWRYDDGESARFVKLGLAEPLGAAHEPATGYADRSQLQSFLDAAPDAIITINQYGIVVSANPAIQTLFGYQEAELLGRNVSMLMPSPDRERHDGYLANYRRTGEARIIGVGRDVTARRKDGSTFPARLSVSEFASGGERFFTGILHDITERVEAQEQQREVFAEHAHATRVFALGEMASSIAHEINQPLTAIVSYADASRKLIEMSRYDTDTLDHALREISSQGQRAGEIIRRLREFVKKKAPTRSSCDINELVRTAAAFTNHDVERYGITLELDLQPEMPEVQVDRLQIEQVILNLIRNSIDAIKESGRMDGQIAVTSRSDNDVVTIRVSDNGPGIKPSEYDSVFDAFYTTKDAGTGLGLSISHSILEAHDGQLTFHPNEGPGVTFALTLPVRGDE